LLIIVTTLYFKQKWIYFVAHFAIKPCLNSQFVSAFSSCVVSTLNSALYNFTKSQHCLKIYPINSPRVNDLVSDVSFNYYDCYLQY